MRITVLAGGVGGAKFLLGVRHFLSELSGAGWTAADNDLTAIVNTGDDVTMHGLRICPDLDSVMYTLGGGADLERGWGQRSETWRVKQALAAYGAEPSWFALGDLDLATHLVRTQMLEAGYPLSAVTEALCRRWDPGTRLLPMTDQRCETHVVLDDDTAASGRRVIHFQEWWVRYHAQLTPRAFLQVGLEDATPAEGVIEALTGADFILLAPSNPVVSINTILSVPGIRSALGKAPAPVVGLSPILGGRPVRGMADSCLPALGVEVSANGVGHFYGSRRGGGVLDGWLIDSGDQAEIAGVRVLSRDLVMTDPAVTAAMVSDAIGLVS
jgi:LPPG:FO 2-phospho-L-lactate transferase